MHYQNEHDFYNNVKNWDFSMIKYIEESLTNWDMYKYLKQISTKDSVVLDLGTGGGEKVLNCYPRVKKVIATDFSQEMINTANENLLKTNKDYITFRTMDNLHMDTPNDYFDIVVARHTCIDAKQIYKTLKKNGTLILRGVDKLDCWKLKMMFKCGQAYNDPLPISLIDYENIINAGFRNAELIPIHIREYYQTKEDFIALLLKTPILDDFSKVDNNLKANLDMKILDKYIEENTSHKGILLIRRYYGIIASK